MTDRYEPRRSAVTGMCHVYDNDTGSWLVGQYETWSRAYTTAAEMNTQAACRLMLSATTDDPGISPMHPDRLAASNAIDAPIPRQQRLGTLGEWLALVAFVCTVYVALVLL